jgi:glycosyltransferase involved in cell wall biosynthesis
MQFDLKKHINTQSRKYDISVIIPTWNNLELLKLCINSIRKHSLTDLQIIVFVNEGKDGTLQWLDSQNDIDYIHSPENAGICYALNSCRSLVKSEYLLYLNDDMYVLPGWDKKLTDEIERLGTKMFMLSATMIEPRETGNPCVVVRDYGDTPANFRENLLLEEFPGLSRKDWSGSTWPPNLVHIDLWDLVGGLSVEFSPGMYSDPDFSRKLYSAGVRIFKGIGDSLVYHFGSKSTKRIRKNKGRKTFLLKWGITPKTFIREFLHSGEDFVILPDEYKPGLLTKIINKIKKAASIF